MTPTEPAADEPEPDEVGDGDAGDDDAPAGAFRLPPGADLTIDWGLRSHLHPDGSPRIIERHLVVPPELAGLRLDHFVKTQIPRLSRTRIQGIIAGQLRRADGHAPKPATIVAAGDHFILRRAAQPEPPCPRTFGVVIRDPRLYVVDKPAGLPVHASAKFYFNTLTRVLGERFPTSPSSRSATGSTARPRAAWWSRATAPPPPRSRTRSPPSTASASSTSRWCTVSRRGTTSTRSIWRCASPSPATRPG